MHKDELLAIARVILDKPTAPFHEGAVREAIRGLLRDCPRVSLREDDFGNLIAHYRGPGSTGPARWAFSAHMDHPGWVRTPEGDWRFLGGVEPEYLEANRTMIRDFGAFAMWDLPAFEVRGGQIHSRACDDLIGCTAIVAALQALDRLAAPVECYGFFTRAEEVGFVGAIHLARSGWVAEAGLTVVSLETSAERPPARMGDGPILRIGDKTSVFNPAASAELQQAAARAGLAVQRCLMAGGTCEGTAFQLYGVRTAALCIALGNYHNRAASPRIEPEFVSIEDFHGLALLCTQIAQHPGSPHDPETQLRQKLEAGAAEFAPYFGRDRDSPFHDP